MFGRRGLPIAYFAKLLYLVPSVAPGYKPDALPILANAMRCMSVSDVSKKLQKAES